MMMMIQGALRVLIELLVCGYSSSDFVFRRSLVFCSGEDTFVALRRTGRGTPFWSVVLHLSIHILVSFSRL